MRYALGRILYVLLGFQLLFVTWDIFYSYEKLTSLFVNVDGKLIFSDFISPFLCFVLPN